MIDSLKSNNDFYELQGYRMIIPFMVEALGTSTYVLTLLNNEPILSGFIVTALFLISHFFRAGSFNPFVSYGRYLSSELDLGHLLIDLIAQITGAILAYIWQGHKVKLRYLY